MRAIALISSGAVAMKSRHAGSTAGTVVNGKKLSGEHALKNGDKIGLGDVLLRFEQD